MAVDQPRNIPLQTSGDPLLYDVRDQNMRLVGYTRYCPPESSAGRSHVRVAVRPGGPDAVDFRTIRGQLDVETWGYVDVNICMSIIGNDRYSFWHVPRMGDIELLWTHKWLEI